MPARFKSEQKSSAIRSANCGDSHWQTDKVRISSAFAWMEWRKKNEMTTQRLLSELETGSIDFSVSWFRMLVDEHIIAFFLFVSSCSVHRVQSAKNVCVESSLIHRQVESIWSWCSSQMRNEEPGKWWWRRRQRRWRRQYFQDWWWYSAQKDAIFAINFSRRWSRGHLQMYHIVAVLRSGPPHAHHDKSKFTRNANEEIS